jgi:hypothetical protein
MSQTRKEIVIALTFENQQMTQMWEQLKQHFENNPIPMSITPLPAAFKGSYQKAGSIFMPGDQEDTTGKKGDFKQTPWFQYLQSQQALGLTQRGIASITGGQDPVAQVESRLKNEKIQEDKMMVQVLRDTKTHLENLSKTIKDAEEKIKSYATTEEEAKKNHKEIADLEKDRLAAAKEVESVVKALPPDPSNIGGGGGGGFLGKMLGLAGGAGFAAYAVTTALNAPGNILAGQGAWASVGRRTMQAGLDPRAYENRLRSDYAENSSMPNFVGGANVATDAIGKMLAGAAIGGVGAGAVSMGALAIPGAIVGGLIGLASAASSAQKTYSEGYESAMSAKIEKEGKNIERWNAAMGVRKTGFGMQESYGLTDAEMSMMWGEGGGMRNIMMGSGATQDEMMPGLIGMSRFGRQRGGGPAYGGGAAKTMMRMTRGTGLDSGELVDAIAGLSGLETRGLSAHEQMLRGEEMIARGFMRGYKDAPMIREELQTLQQIARQGATMGGIGSTFAQTMIGAGTNVMGGQAGSAALEVAATAGQVMTGAQTQTGGIAGMANAIAANNLFKKLREKGVDKDYAMKLYRMALSAGPGFMMSSTFSGLVEEVSGGKISGEEAGKMGLAVVSDKMGLLPKMVPGHHEGAMGDKLDLALWAITQGATPDAALAFGDAASKGNFEKAFKDLEKRGASKEYKYKAGVRGGTQARSLEMLFNAQKTRLGYSMEAFDMMDTEIEEAGKEAGMSKESIQAMKSLNQTYTVANTMVSGFSEQVGIAGDNLVGFNGGIIAFLKTLSQYGIYEAPNVTNLKVAKAKKAEDAAKAAERSRATAERNAARGRIQ